MYKFKCLIQCAGVPSTITKQNDLKGAVKDLSFKILNWRTCKITHYVIII